jgi:hypothetical protein
MIGFLRIDRAHTCLEGDLLGVKTLSSVCLLVLMWLLLLCQLRGCHPIGSLGACLLGWP